MVVSFSSPVSSISRASSASITWELNASRWKPAFSSHLLSAVEDRKPGRIGKQKPVLQRLYERSTTSQARLPSGIQACQKVSPRVEFSPLAKLLIRS